MNELTPEARAARLACREALANFHRAKLDLIRAARALRRLVPDRDQTPALLKRQAG